MKYKASQIALPLELHPNLDDWTFNGASTRELTHCYHDYPARMIPQIASKILDMFAPVDARLLFDPYCGTGTSLVEGLIRGINVVGTDLNPLARLIAQAKTTVLEIRQLDDTITTFNNYIRVFSSSKQKRVQTVYGITRLDFWFKNDVIEKLSYIKDFMAKLKPAGIKLFFQIAFSETVRESSNTRNEEFKLYRYDTNKLKTFNPDVFRIMAEKLSRNRFGLMHFQEKLETFKRPPSASIYDFNSVVAIPGTIIKPASIDIVVTSPPYGDSHTTVAYGQYSRLSAAWLDLDEPAKIDSILMGGKTYKKLPPFPCEELNDALHTILQSDKKRAYEVSAFYLDLQNSIANVAQIIKPGGYACYVVGNRKVKGVVLPTDTTIHDFFEECGFDYIDTFHRSIPNKRMPMKNSPTNIHGAVDTTMVQEYIVVMRKRIPLKLMEARTKYIAKRKK